MCTFIYPASSAIYFIQLQIVSFSCVLGCDVDVRNVESAGIDVEVYKLDLC
jgi:hypothetical protein